MSTGKRGEQSYRLRAVARGGSPLPPVHLAETTAVRWDARGELEVGGGELATHSV